MTTHPLLPDILKARDAMAKAASDTRFVADELRRYQKFAKPGQASPHIVQLRQRQATARLDSARSKQAFLTASQLFMRDEGLTLPPGEGLESFMQRWLRKNVPTDAS